MPVGISVGPPTLTVNQGSTFVVTALNGEITTESEQGVFAGDTRFVSHWSISANDRCGVRLTALGPADLEPDGLLRRRSRAAGRAPRCDPAWRDRR